MDKQEVETLLARILRRETTLYDAPSEADWLFQKEKFRMHLLREFMDFIELMAVYSFPGEILNVVRTGRTNGNDTVADVYDAEVRAGRWQAVFVPFYRIGNGDYFCLNRQAGSESAVFHYRHQDATFSEYCPSFASWLKNLRSFLENDRGDSGSNPDVRNDNKSLPQAGDSGR